MEQKSFSIGTETWIIQTLTGTQSLFYAAKIAKILKGAAIGVEITETSLGATNINVGKAIAGIFDSIEAVDFTNLIKNLLKDSLIQPSVAGVNINEWFDTTFSGRLDDLTIILAYIVNLNYAKFLQSIRKKGLWGILTQTESSDTTQD